MNRFQELQSTLKKGEGAVIFSSVSRFYLSGFSSSDGTLFITPSFARLYLDSRYLEMAQRAQKKGEISEEILLCASGFSEDFERYGKENEGGKIFFEDRRITVSALSNLKEKFPSVNFVPLGGAIEAMRIVKSEEEIEKIASSQALAEEAFEYILGRIEVGRSERELAAELEFFMKKNGASAPSFETIFVSGTRTSLPHGRASEALLEKDAFITMDFGCVLDGYSSDMTRTVCLGRASDEMKLVYETVLSAQKAGIFAAKAGVLGREVDRAAREVIEKAGFGEYFGHSTGHGIGLEVHEAPSFSPKSEANIPAGAVLSVEPGIYLPGKFGVRIEDLVVVGEGICRNLNRSPKNLIEL
jgi:Xaa-Pro aminopeptidase